MFKKSKLLQKKIAVHIVGFVMQLELTINGQPIDYTVIGRATGTSNISGMFLI